MNAHISIERKRRSHSFECARLCPFKLLSAHEPQHYAQRWKIYVDVTIFTQLVCLRFFFLNISRLVRQYALTSWLQWYKYIFREISIIAGPHDTGFSLRRLWTLNKKNVCTDYNKICKDKYRCNRFFLFRVQSLRRHKSVSCGRTIKLRKALKRLPSELWK